MCLEQKSADIPEIRSISSFFIAYFSSLFKDSASDFGPRKYAPKAHGLVRRYGLYVIDV